MTSGLLPLQVVIIPIAGVFPFHGAPLDVTLLADNLEWRHTIPGGYASCTFDLAEPLASAEWLPYARVVIFDTQTGGQLWAGILEDPARSADASGERHRMQALGGSSTFKYVKQPRVWIDSALESWGRGQPPYQLEAVTTGVDKADIVNGPGVAMSVPQGTDLTPVTGLAYITYLVFLQTGQFVGSLDFTHAGGPGGDPTYLVRVIDAAGDTIYDHPMTPAATPVVLLDTVAELATPFMSLAWETGFPPVEEAPDGLWQRFGAIFVKPILATKFGTTLTDPPTTYTTWFEVVGDLIGGSGWLPLIDGPTAFLDTSGLLPQAIPHFAYPDGTTAEDVLTDLLAIERAYYWAVWELLDNGRYLFEWRLQPLLIAYDFDTAFENFESPGSATDIFNAVTIRFRDPTGNICSQTFHRDVPLLDWAGVLKAELIDLGDNVDNLGATIANTATTFLEEHAFPTRSGTLTVSRAVLNNFLGFEIDQWNLRPPFLCTVNGSAPGGVGTVRDGRTVFRCTGITFRASDGAAILELDQYPLATWNQLRWALPQGRRR